jgi:diacylglycerol O-acyltransferase
VRDQLGVLDSVFLNAETPAAPMHISGILLFTARPQAAGRPGMKALFETIEHRLPLLPRCRQRVVRVPFDLGPPVWVDDEHFDIRNHLWHRRLPAGGGVPALLDLAARLHAKPLDRDRPLWEIHLVDGLGDGRAAVYAKLHHCMVDGASAVELAMVLLDLDAEGELAPVPPVAPPTRPRPGSVELVTGSLGEAASRARRAAAGLARRPASILDGVIGGLGAAASARELLPLLRPAPPGPLNGRLGSRRRVATVSLPLAAAKDVKNEFGATINDVVLATVGEAIAEYLDHRGLNRSGLTYRVLVPVSTRGGANASMGNQLAGMFVELPVGPMPAARRMEAVMRLMAGVKQQRQSRTASRVIDLAALTPAPFHPVLARLGSVNQRVINLIVSNVPGMQMPVYSGGSRLLAAYPLLPLGPNMGMVVCCLSYDGELHFGLVSNPDAVPEFDVLVRGLSAGFERLRTVSAAAG